MSWLRDSIFAVSCIYTNIGQGEGPRWPRQGVGAGFD